MSRPTTTTPPTQPTTTPAPPPRPTSPWQDPPGTPPRGPRYIPTQRTSSTGDAFALPAPIRTTATTEHAVGVSSWTRITITESPEPAAGDRCAYCTRPTTATGLVVEARLPYCDRVCLDLAVHTCADCGDDTRTPITSGPLPGCHTAGTGWTASTAPLEPVHLRSHWETAA
ncbi:hypothetical protein [Micromonospora sp. NPDC004704]